MNRNLVIKRLWWKEIQQLWPLVVLLIMLGGLLQTIFAVVPGFYDAWRHTAIFVALPGLFAVGAGALIVGQEKELRTIQWIRSLPIAPRDIISTKLFIGLTGLAVVWLASLLIAGATGDWPWAQRSDISFPMFVVHSFFVLLVGYATAWRIQSSFLSLLLLIPLACLPIFFASFHAWLMNATKDQAFNDLLMAAYSAIFSIGFLWAGWRFALRQLGPHAGTRPQQGQLVAIAFSDDLFTHRRVAPISALVWQFASQNRVSLVGLTVALVVSGLVIGSKSGYPEKNLSFLAYLTGAVACSWLGLLAFQSDGYDRRAMFLADRGIAPWKVWLTRQILPVSCLMIGLAALAISLPRPLGWMQWIVAMALGIYACSQFIAQLIRSPILGTIAAVLYSAVTIALFTASVVFLFSSPWLVVASVLAFALATFVMTRSWMDGKGGWRNWLKYVGIAAIAWILPMLPFLTFIVTAPRITSSERQHLEQLANEKVVRSRTNSQPAAHDSSSTVTIARARENFMGEPVEMIDPTESFSRATPPNASSQEMAGEVESESELISTTDFTTANWTRQLALVQAQFTRFQNGVPHNRFLRALIPRLLLIRMQLDGEQAGQEQSASDETESSEQTVAPEQPDATAAAGVDSESARSELLAGYRTTIEVILETIQRLRTSWKLADQAQADRLEMVLLNEIREQRAAEYFGVELLKRTRARLGNATERDTARRLAIAASWKRAQTDGGYHFLASNTTSTDGEYSKTAWTNWAQRDLMAVALLQLVDAPASDRPALRQQFFDRFGKLAAQTGGSQQLPNEQGLPQLLYGEMLYGELVSYGVLANWYSGWEQLAEDAGDEQQ